MLMFHYIVFLEWAMTGTGFWMLADVRKIRASREVIAGNNNSKGNPGAKGKHSSAVPLGSVLTCTCRKRYWVLIHNFINMTHYNAQPTHTKDLGSVGLGTWDVCCLPLGGLQEWHDLALWHASWNLHQCHRLPQSAGAKGGSFAIAECHGGLHYLTPKDYWLTIYTLLLPLKYSMYQLNTLLSAIQIIREMRHFTNLRMCNAWEYSV